MTNRYIKQELTYLFLAIELSNLRLLDYTNNNEKIKWKKSIDILII